MIAKGARPGGVQNPHGKTPINETDAIGKPNRSAAALEVAILDLLADQPRAKWEIREALHEPESYVLKHLQALKRAGQIKVIGKILDQRKWALVSWQEPAPTPVPRKAPTHVKLTKHSTLRAPHERPPSEPMPKQASWWCHPMSRAEWIQAVEAHQLRMRVSRIASTVNPWSREYWL